MNDNTVYVGRRMEIFPTDSQKEFLNRYIDMYRGVYNWGMEQQLEHYERYNSGLENSGFITFFTLSKQFTKYKHSLPKNHWMRKFPSTTAKLALKDVVRSFDLLFRGLNRPPGYKSKRTAPMTFKTRKERCYIEDGRLRIEGLSRGETIKCSTHVYDGHNGYPNKNKTGFGSPSITRDKYGRYFVSFLYQVPIRQIDSEPVEAIGIDLGIRQTFTLSTGEVFNQPDFTKLEKRISRQEKRLQKDYERARRNRSRTKTDDTGNANLESDIIPKSNRCLKREAKQHKLYRKISNTKRTFYYQTINKIVKRNPKAICIETMRVEDLKRNNPFITKHIANVSFYEIGEIFKHKCAQYNVPLIRADKEFPSSQLCSNCGYRHREIGKKHTFVCPECGFTIDRDLNAAINLRDLYIG